MTFDVWAQFMIFIVGFTVLALTAIMGAVIVFFFAVVTRRVIKKLWAKEEE